ncbi:MAG: carboxymuconolactone decarboxylase family protein [Bacteroidales bacterium]|nr:carboxymuconolactone decarboxylase family protein [Bacteroidales bacterium]MDD4149629.1 carboxymuconolactone decarboxylase family protein [Bacteroidales bacterium]
MGKYSEQAKNVFDFLGTLSKESPKIAEGFTTMYKSAGVDGALSVKHKELMSLGIAISIRCEGCIALHTKGALEAGATKAEIIETIGVSILMGGGPSITYGNKAYEAMNEMM